MALQKNIRMSDAEIDSLISQVEESLNKAVSSVSVKKAEGDFEENPEMTSDMDSDAPSMEETGETFAAPGGEQEEPMGDEAGQEEPMGDEAGQEEPMGDEAGQEESMDDEGLEDEHISDEELRHIYSQMDHGELERHYMILRGILNDAYSSMDEGAPAEPMGDEAGMAGQPDEEEAAPEMAMKSEPKKTSIDTMEKKESSKKVESLEKSNKELQDALAKAIKAIETLSKPQRKSFSTEIEYIKKSEPEPVEKNESKPKFESMEKGELLQRCNTLCGSRGSELSKSERNIINSFVLRGEGQDQVIEILRRF